MLNDHSRVISIEALLIVLIYAFIVLFALAMNEACRTFFLQCLEMDETSKGRILYAFVVFIIVAFIIVLISIYYPEVIENYFYYRKK